MMDTVQLRNLALLILALEAILLLVPMLLVFKIGIGLVGKARRWARPVLARARGLSERARSLTHRAEESVERAERRTSRLRRRIGLSS